MAPFITRCGNGQLVSFSFQPEEEPAGCACIDCLILYSIVAHSCQDVTEGLLGYVDQLYRMLLYLNVHTWDR